MTTKEQERQAIEEIRKIVEGLGENSYVGFAMEEVLELAEDNIREDTAYSMKKNAEIAWERADKAEKESKLLNAELGTAKKITEENNKVIAKLKADIYKLKANEVPEELIEEMYNMAYDKEAEMIEKMEETADQMADASIAGEDVQKFAEDYKAQKEKRNRYAKMMDTLDAREKMRKRYYHAATPEIMRKIVADGAIKRGRDGYVYICEKPEDAVKFVAIRGHDEVAVIEVILPANKVKESFDHSVQFFQCKAFMYEEDIKVRPNAEVVEYSFK